MFYYVYKTTHVDSGKFYIGRRASKLPPDQDDYIGSGKRLMLAIDKYGRAAFVKEVLKLCDSYEDLIVVEKSLVTKDVLSDPMCYNLAEGGWGGHTDISNRVYVGTPESNRKISESKIGRKRPDLVERHKTDESFKFRWRGQARTDEDKAKKSIALKASISEGRHGGFGEFTCPYCGVVGRSMNNMKRWHFDNCKRKDVL